MALRDELARELHALRFAARQRRRGLAERDVPEAHLAQRLELVGDARDGAEEVRRLLHRDGERVGDREAAVLHLERLAVVPEAAARVARDEHVGQEVHLDAQHAVALARLAAPALHVEREAPRLVAARPRVGQARRRGRAGARRCRCTSRGSTGACGRWAPGRSRRPCRRARAPRRGRTRRRAPSRCRASRAPPAAACRR